MLGSKRLAALMTVAFLGLTAAQISNSQIQQQCEVNIEQFGQLGYVHVDGDLQYQYRMVINVKNVPSGTDPVGDATLSGPASSYGPLNADGLHTGRNIYTRYFPTDPSRARSRVERLDFSLRCVDGSGNDVGRDTATATTLVYKPGQAQALTQPWRVGCPQTVVVDSRGSDSKGKTLGVISAPGAAFINELRKQEKLYGSYSGYVVFAVSNPYPAKGGIVNFLAAKAHLPLAYHRSVVAGKRWLKSELTKLHSLCRRSRVYLAGYSQGSQVSGDVYQKLGWHIAGMVLFGDPSFNGKDASDRVNYSPVYSGALHKRPAFNSARVWSFCHKLDPVCQGVPAYYVHYRFRYHNDYTRHGEPQTAADYFFK